LKDKIKELFGGGGSKGFLMNMFYGGSAAAIPSLLTYHFEYVRTQLINDVVRVTQKG
jgi:hypothetical protein